MNQKDDLPLPHANPEAGNDDSPDNPERRRVLTGIAAVGFGLALAGCNTEEQASGPRRAAPPTCGSTPRCTIRCATSW